MARCFMAWLRRSSWYCVLSTPLRQLLRPYLPSPSLKMVPILRSARYGICVRSNSSTSVFTFSVLKFVLSPLVFAIDEVHHVIVNWHAQLGGTQDFRIGPFTRPWQAKHTGAGFQEVHVDLVPVARGHLRCDHFVVCAVRVRAEDAKAQARQEQRRLLRLTYVGVDDEVRVMVVSSQAHVRPGNVHIGLNHISILMRGLNRPSTQRG